LQPIYFKSDRLPGVLDVVDFPIMRHGYAVHHTDKRLSPTAQAFRAFVPGSAVSVA
jgi:hypothetical protein